jgi:hypothetical protein
MQTTGIARRAALACALMAIVWLAAAAALAQDSEPNRVGLVVVHAGGQPATHCVEFDEEQITGLELVQRAGLEVSLDDTNPLGTAVCRLEGQGCGFPEETCFCQCQGSPCVYWSYWNWTPGNGWRYSNTSAAIRSLGDGEVDGWFWGDNDFGAGSPLPALTFEEICPPPAAVPTATATATDVPSPIPPTHTADADSVNESAGSSTRTPAPRLSDTPSPTPGSAPVLTGNTAATPHPTQTPPPAAATRQPREMGVIVATPTSAGGAATVTPAAPSAAPLPSEEVGAPPDSGATSALTPVAVARLASAATPRPTRDGPTPTPLLALDPAPVAARQAEAPPSRPEEILLAAAIAFGAAGACGVGLVVAKKKT